MIKQPSLNQKFTEGGVLTTRNKEWVRLVTEMDILEGSGSPEGVIEAKTRTLYMDDSAASGSILYIKQLADIGGDRTTGWKLV